MLRAAPCVLLAIFAVTWVASGAAADPIAPPWSEPGMPLPSWVASARVLKADQGLLSGPFAGASRRGSAMKDAALPIFAARRGEGCAGSWFEVGAEAWVCDDAVELSAKPSVEPLARSMAEAADGLPFRYYFVGPDGSFGYRNLDAADVGEPDMQLEPGFAVAVVEERVVDGNRYGHTKSGLWVPFRDLGPARSLIFQGADIPKDAVGIPVAWVIADTTRVLGKPSPIGAPEGTRLHFDKVPFFEEVTSFAGAFTRIGEGAWIASKDLRHPSVAPPPPEVDTSAGERWIDVELATQTLVAYEGSRPVFATLVSSGKGRGDAYNATPVGTSRIWVKLLSSSMDNLEDENAARYYRMEDVPWVQFFSKGVGVHGAYWHRSFGRVRSHGCVNLAPLDAQRLFWWTSPHLPAGWSAVLPTKHELGTLVRVR